MSHIFGSNRAQERYESSKKFMAKFGEHPEVSQFLKDENNRLIRDFEKKVSDNKIREMYRKDALEARQALACKSKAIEIRYRDNHKHE